MALNAYSHVPLNVPEANTPNLTVPAIDRPSIMPLNFNFIGIGRSTLVAQEIAFSFNCRSNIGPLPFFPDISPLGSSAAALNSSVASNEPVGASIVMFHFSNLGLQGLDYYCLYLHHTWNNHAIATANLSC